MPVRLDEKPAIEAIPMTPLIDVVFLLLIFFLVAASLSEEEERQMDVQLPAASEAMPLSVKPREIVVNITADGRYLTGGETVDLEGLERVFRAAAANNPGRASVLFRADKRCPWQFVVAAMNACAKAKVRYKATTLASPTG
jgi:biopolymer transport protein ExbD